MNFVHLAKKYLGVDCLCEDRSYEGLIWPPGLGDKPSLELFEAYQREEDRIVRVEEHKKGSQTELRKIRLHQARAKAAEDLIPFEHRLETEIQQVYQEAFDRKKQAIELQKALELREHVCDTWREISKAQEMLAEEAQKYLDDTAYVLTWDMQKIPPEIMQKRNEAHDRVLAGTVVHGHWQALRKKELPTREEMIEAIRMGGAQLERIRKACQDVALKHPRPRTSRHY